MAKYVPYLFSGSRRYAEEGREALDRLAVSAYRKPMDTKQGEELERRRKILEFWGKHGFDACRDAYGTSRATLFRWKKGGVPKSRAHRHGYAGRSPDWRLLEEIRRIRGVPETCRLGKGKLLPLLETFCLAEGIPEELSESRVGRILGDLKRADRLPDPKLLRLSARTGRLLEKAAVRQPKLRRGGYLPALPGDLLQVDGVLKLLNGIRRYVFTAVDLNSRWTYSRAYPSASSRNGADFLKRLLAEAPFKVVRIQTDNGSEFAKEFREAAEAASLTHFFNWVRQPKYQGWIESFNGTVQEEFLDWHLFELAGTTDEFNPMLEAWTSWYNERRPHSALVNPATGRQRSPMAYLAATAESQRE